MKETIKDYLGNPLNTRANAWQEKAEELEAELAKTKNNFANTMIQHIIVK